MEALGREERFEVLNVLDFTSTRKRMSVVIRAADGRIRLLVKGADDVIYERMKPNQAHAEETLKHLEEFAMTGM